MAMGLMMAIVKSRRDEWRIESAGVWARPGQPAAENTQLLISELGIDLNDFESRPISLQILSEFNLILTMENGQKEALRTAFPQFASKIYLLSEMIGETNEIVDPVGQPLVDFKATAREIQRILSQGFDQIRALAEDDPDGNA
ncbi:MAG: hypothetical protein JXA78_12615 [Anaerolineales bacterium]|nr:hypothetical protein [Anaerolineales bacterium]